MGFLRFVLVVLLAKSGYLCLERHGVEVYGLFASVHIVNISVGIKITRCTLKVKKKKCFYIYSIFKCLADCGGPAGGLYQKRVKYIIHSQTVKECSN